jgi:hypothetical protein
VEEDHMSRKVWIICIAVLVLVGLYWTRYQVVQLSGVGGFYKINRFTGQVTLVAGTFTQPVRGVAETRSEIQRQQESKKGEAPTAEPQVTIPQKAK